MKLMLITLFSLVCLQSHAEIIQQEVIVDAPVVSVRAGQQQNGNLAIEKLTTNTTTSAQDSLASTSATTSDSIFGGSPQRGAPSSFQSLAVDEGISPITPPVVNPVTPPVPEPETYALMAIGLSGLLLARRKRANHSLR
jgi:hypothetical protein